MDEEKYTELAKADFTMKMIGGVIAGIIGIIAGIVLIVFACIKNEYSFIGFGIALIAVGILVGVIDGYILFSRHKKKSNKEIEKDE